MLNAAIAIQPQHRDTEHERTTLLTTTTGKETLSFDQLFNRFYNRLLVIALRELQNVQDAEDVVQQTFLEASRDFENYRREGKLSSWLYSIHRNNILDAIRKRQRSRANHLRLVTHETETQLQEPKTLDGVSGDVVTNEISNGELSSEVVTSLAYRTSPETLLIRLQTMERILDEIGELDEQTQKLVELYLNGNITYRELRHRLQTAKTLNEHPQIRDRLRAVLKEI